MKRILWIWVALFVAVSGFAGYKLVFQNGAVLEVTGKPDLTGKMVQATTVDGKRVILPRRMLDLEATRQINRPVPRKPLPVVKKPAPKTPVPVSTTKKESTEPREPLVITEATVGKREPVTPPPATRKETGTTGVGTQGEEPDMEEGPVDDQGHGERYWRQRFAQNQSELNAVDTRIEQIQLELNRLGSQKRIYYDDEVYRRRVEGKMSQLRKQLEQLQQKRDKIRAQKEKMLEEARKSGALPGWYRDYVD